MAFELDLRKIHLGQSGIASFATKPQAIAFAKSRGWLSRDVTRAYNRFCMFWVVYQGFGDTLRFLGKTDVVELPCSAIQPCKRSDKRNQTNRRSIAMATKKQQERPVIVTTEHRGVFFGYATDTSGDRFQLKRARMAIYWGTTRGLMELAETGPTKTSKISARADLDVRKVTAVFEVTPEAAAKWEAA